MIELIKKIPWYAWVISIIAILIIWQNLSGWAAARKLYEMALDNLRADQSKVVETLEQALSEREKELGTIYEQLEKVKRQQSAVKAENEQLKGRIRELQAQRENIVVPGDPDRLVDELHRRGFGSAHRLRR